MDRRGFNHNQRDTNRLNGGIKGYVRPLERNPLPGDRFGRGVPSTDLNSVRSEWGSEVASVAGSESTGYLGSMESDDDGTTIYGAASRTGTRGSTYRGDHNSSGRLRQSLPVQDQMFGYSGPPSFHSLSESRFGRRYQPSEPSESDFRRSTPPPNFDSRQDPIQKEVSAWSTYRYEERPKIVPGRRDQPPPEWQVGKSEFSAKHKFTPPKQVSGYPDDNYVPLKRSTRPPLPTQASSRPPAAASARYLVAPTTYASTTFSPSTAGSSKELPTRDSQSRIVDSSAITNGDHFVKSTARAPGMPYSEPPRVAIGWAALPSAPVPGPEEFPALPTTSRATTLGHTSNTSVPKLQHSSIPKAPLSKQETPTGALKKVAGGWGISLVSNTTANPSVLSSPPAEAKSLTVITTSSTSAVQLLAIHPTSDAVSESVTPTAPFKSGWTDITGVVRKYDFTRSSEERKLISKPPMRGTQEVEQQSLSAPSEPEAIKGENPDLASLDRATKKQEANLRAPRTRIIVSEELDKAISARRIGASDSKLRQPLSDKVRQMMEHQRSRRVVTRGS